MPIPISRESLRGLKAQREEEERLRQISVTVNHIYNSAVQTASMKGETSYKHEIPRLLGDNRFRVNRTLTSDIYETSMGEIISELQSLFPDCSVKHTTLTMGQDGKMYDVSEMAASVLPFINKQQSKEYIVVDWS
jgi:hypothetical protein